MVISIVLDTEYMGVAERNKWFLKSVSTAMKEDTLIVTHSYFKDHLEDTVNGCADRFYSEFEMDRVSVEDIEKLDICYIPDKLFDSIYEKCGSRTKQLIYLFNNRVTQIEKIIIDSIDEALRKRGQQRPDFIFNSLHIFSSIKYIAKLYDCPIVPYVFSAIRKVHGYSQTLYMAHINDDLFNSPACTKLYEQDHLFEYSFPFLTKKEILALLGKRQNMTLLPLIDRPGKYEIGVVGEGFHVIPESYQNDSVTDDDIYYASKLFFDSKDIITRQHPIQMDQAGIGRAHLKNDPAAFILSSKRVVTVQSQMIIKAAIWNRSPIVISNGLPYSILLNRNIDDDGKIDDEKLNFILFVYFVPDTCMFSSEYWNWRFTNPTSLEIAWRHMHTILDELHISETVLLEKKDRLKKLLELRNCDEEEIIDILSPDRINDVPYNIPSSCIKMNMDDGSIKSLYFLNHEVNGDIETKIRIHPNAVSLDFIPQNDMDGVITIKKISIDGSVIQCNIIEKYYKKNESVITLKFEKGKKKIMKAIWQINSYDR